MNCTPSDLVYNDLFWECVNSEEILQWMEVSELLLEGLKNARQAISKRFVGIDKDENRYKKNEMILSIYRDKISKFTQQFLITKGLNK